MNNASIDMATVLQQEMVTLTINDVEVEVPKGELIVESVKRLGLEIPIFCYHPRMKPVGMCRMCLVEVGFKQPDGSVRMMPKPQAGCTLPADANMVIFTDSEAVHRDRKGVLEFLLINHPLDCPICDRGGECPLQNNTMAYGPSTSRFIEMKRHLPKAFPLSKYVTLDLERCIQCGRCVRFTEEISGDSQLAFRFRGASMQPTTFQLTDFESKFSGNVIEICPVGALTSSKYRFRARPWDLETGPGICTVTPDGANIWIDHRAGKLVRINGRTNESVNEEWTSDRSKFGYDFYNDSSRILAPNMRSGDEFVRVGWSQAYEQIATAFSDAGKVAVLMGGMLSNEALYLGQKMAREVLKTPNVDTWTGAEFVPYAERIENLIGVEPVQASIAELEHCDSVLVFGTSLADEQPMNFLRVRKGWFQRGMKVVVAHSEPTDLDSFATLILRYHPGTENWVASALASLSGVAGVSVDIAKAAEKSGVSESDLKAAAEIMKSGDRVVVSTHSLDNSKNGREAAAMLAGFASNSGARFNQLALTANGSATRDLGARCDTGVGNVLAAKPGASVRKSLEMATAGELKHLMLIGFDPIEEFPDRDLAVRALESAESVVYLNANSGESAAYATLILPLALPAESDGTYTSSERRVQRMDKQLAAPGDAKSGWRVMSELLMRDGGVPAFHPKETLDELARIIPSFGGISYNRLTEDGLVLGKTGQKEVDLGCLSQIASNLS